MTTVVQYIETVPADLQADAVAAWGAMDGALLARMTGNKLQVLFLNDGAHPMTSEYNQEDADGNGWTVRIVPNAEYMRLYAKLQERMGK